MAAAPPPADQPPGPPPSPEEDAGGGSRRKPFLLRLPPDLMAELRAWSSLELRSLNGHLEYLLREAVRQRKRAATKKKETPP